MRRAIFATVALVAMSTPTAPAQAADDLEWEGSHCHEIVALYPAPAIDPVGVLVLLVYECDEVKIGGTTYKEVAVSEISVTQVCASGATCPVRSRLLRQVADNHALVAGLRSLGLDDSFFGQIEYDAAALEADVSIPSKRTYSVSAEADTPGAPEDKAKGDKGQAGASYTYETKDHRTIRYSYTNYSQTAREATVTVDTTGDAQLAEWLGQTRATTTGFVTRGHWTGTAEIAAG